MPERQPRPFALGPDGRAARLKARPTYDTRYVRETRKLSQ
jgi:hypothetical protein